MRYHLISVRYKLSSLFCQRLDYSFISIVIFLLWIFLFLYLRIPAAVAADVAEDKEKKEQTKVENGNSKKKKLILPEIESRGDLTISYQHFFEGKNNHKVQNDYKTPLSTIRDKVTDNTVGVDGQAVTYFLNKRMNLTYGGMWYRDFVSAKREKWTPNSLWSVSTDKAYPDGSTYDTYGIYLLNEGDALRMADKHIVRLNGGSITWNGGPYP